MVDQSTGERRARAMALLLRDGSPSDADSQRVLEQYKLYVEMADRVSNRRQQANTYLLSINSVLLTALGLVIEFVDTESWRAAAMLTLIPASGFAVSVIWFFLIRSYRQLNSGKFQVIHMIEALLPIAPYDAEWEALGRGESFQLYWPFSHVEQYVPVVFALLYIVGMALVLTLF